MRIAIPIANGALSMHFGHCEKFVIMDVDVETKEIKAEEALNPPPHEPGLLPRWLAEKNVNLIIAGGMGQRAQSLFQENNIKVFVGAPSKSPVELVTDYMNNVLTTGENFCDH
jgi:ATP-binding protein involved in chromosome partitioning